MKVPKGAGGAESSATLAIPAIVVILVLVFGATIYLWRARYIRRRTAYVVMLVTVVAIVGLGTWNYLHPMAATS